MPVSIRGKVSAYNEQLIAANTPTVLVDAPTIAVDLDDGPNFQVTITANRMLGNPTGVSKEKLIWLLVEQDNIGGHDFTFDTNWIPVDATNTVNYDADSVTLIRAFARDMGAGEKWFYTVEHVGEFGGGGGNGSDAEIVGAVGAFQDNALTEYVLGGFSFNPLVYNATTVNLRLIGQFSTVDVTGAFELRLYDMGPGGVAFTPVRRATVSVPYADRDKQMVVDQQLALVASPGVNVNEIHTIERVYELRAYLNVSSGATNSVVSWAGLNLTGTGGAPGPFELGTANNQLSTVLAEQTIGGFYFNPTLYDVSSVVLRLLGMLTNATDPAGVFELRLYDMGDGITPISPVLRSRCVITYPDADLYIKVDQLLTLVPSPGVDQDEIHSVARAYELRLYLTGTGSPVGYASWGGLSAEGNRPPSNPVVLRPAQITSDVTDYAPSGFNGTITALFIDSDAPRTINSLSAAGFVDGDVLKIVNEGSFAITLLHDDGVTGAANYRFTSPTAADVELAPNATIVLVRDASTARWRIFSGGAAANPPIDSLTPGLALAPLALWQLDTLTGYLVDSSGNGFTLTQSGTHATIAAPVIGKTGKTFASSAYFIRNNIGPVMLGAATAFCAVRPSGAGIYWLLSGGGVGGTASPTDNINWGLRIIDNRVAYYHETATRTAHNSIPATTWNGLLTANEWHVVGFTRNSAGTGIKLFANGAVIHTDTLTAPTTSGTQTNVIVGIKPGGSEPYSGSMCGIHIFNTELTEADMLYFATAILKQVSQ